MAKAHDTHARRWHVRGRVQGVFFRASTREQAQALGLTGYARNLPDGRVEVLAVGSPDALDRLETWLREGPRMARVEGLETQAVPPPEPLPAGFRTD
ncbi:MULTISPECIES: acylphosphatase [unclassified Thioalkalivibrio]|jgi:acylphosphatase|uniref:acylphosphatase n=1 Tax=unclassified Thioalkalivibrio TaxID=2621013 RepID=UPI0003622212|nr:MULTISPECIES: acylphosphatase [unclassified Thioalkalivibrio]